MTIAGRNRILIVGICISILLLAVGTVCCVIIAKQGILTDMTVAPQSTFWILQQPFFSYTNYAAMIRIASLPLIAVVILISIFFLFEKTHALEISFFSLFIFTLSMEPLQLLFPLQKVYPLLIIFSASIARTLFFFRFFACLSLLTASLFAHKTFTREIGAAIFLLSFISFALAHTIPINTVRALSFFSFSELYCSLLYSFHVIVCALAVFSFLFVGIFRSISEYRQSALWLLVILIAHVVLLYTGSWAFTIIGIAALAGGSFLFLRAIHQFYLWQ